MITVFLVDDHEIARRGVADLLKIDPGLDVVGEAATVGQALARTPLVRPDIAVLDVRLPDGNGVELCRELRSLMPGLNCLMLTSFSDEQASLDALLAGAAGYLLKDIDGRHLADAVRRAAGGRPVTNGLGPGELEQRLRAARAARDPLAPLSRIERRILVLISEGLTNREIATNLHLAEKTVKNYVSRLFSKLGVHRRTQAAALLTRSAGSRQGISAEPNGGRQRAVPLRS